MKDELQSKLVEILTAIQSAAGTAGDFAMAQLPDIAQSYVAYGRAISVFNVFLGLAMLGAAAWAFRGLRLHMKKHGEIFDCDPAVVIPGGFFIFAAGLSGVIQLKAGIATAALVWFAPKVWLLKEIAVLLK